MAHRLSIPCLVLVLVGCAESRPALDTGVPDGTPVNELTDEDAQQICRAAQELANDVFGPEEQHHVQCTVTAVAYDLADLGMCDDSYADCIAEPYDADPADFDCESATAPMLESCTATIGEIEACANAQIRVFDDVVSQLDCGLVDDPDRIAEIMAELEGAANPEACASLPENCPIFFGDLGD